MIRTTVEAPFFGLWRDAKLLRALGRPQNLTTARYEPILHRQLGSGHLDLLFESGAQSCILGGIRLDAANLITRERSPFIWPAHLAAALDYRDLDAIEKFVTPWLRSIARARPMVQESIRRFAPSTRFDRARDADLVGAAQLARTLPRLAPFVYARRFAADAHVLISCTEAALAQAVLVDIAGVVETARDRETAGDERDDDAFSRAWYGTPARPRSSGTPDIIIADSHAARDAVVVLETAPADDSTASFVDVPSPVPWDLLFSFDAADAPAVTRFTVSAVEPAIRRSEPLPPARAAGASSGTIVLALSAEALALRGADVEEAEILGSWLTAAGFRVHVASRTSDAALADAQLVHIFGDRFDSHTVSFGERARQLGVGYVFDVPPIAPDPSSFPEENFPFVYRAAVDDADIDENLTAYEQRRIDSRGPQQPSRTGQVLAEARFAELTLWAAGVLCVEEDLDALQAVLPAAAAGRIIARGVFALAEPAAGVIGHLVPRRPFAFVHAAIAARSHCLYAAVAAQRLELPLVLAGPVYDLDYLYLLRAMAPSAIVLADAQAQTVSALYRAAAIWVDAAPRPRTAAGVVRAVACGALPVLPMGGGLSRIAGAGAPSFSLASIDDCARVMSEAIAAPDRQTRVSGLRTRLSARRDQNSTYAAVIAAYSRAAISV
jgi:hypothetical protein